jgi:hypothetical protein
MVAAFAVPAWAQGKECTDEFKSSTYQKWYDNRKEKQDVAYQAAKEYLEVCTTEDAYTSALKKFRDAYDAINESTSNKNKLQEFYTKKNYAEAVAVGKKVVEKEPDFAPGYMLIALSGYNATTTGNTSLLPDAEQAARKALEMVEQGKPFAPFASKDSAVGWLNYIIGKSKVKSAPAEAIPFILKGARLDADLKKAPGLYLDLFQAYGDGPLAKLAADYERDFKGKDESPESKLALANIYQMMDRQIDAMARAVALATGNDKTTYMTALTQVYKDRNKDSDAGLTELLAGVLNKTLPDMPTPLTAPPPATPPTTPPTTGNGNGAATTNGTSTTGNTRPATPPASKPKPRSHHRRT